MNVNFLIELSSGTFSSNKSGSISRSEAVQILKKSTDQTKKPIATVKPMPRNENNGNSSDLLGDILSRQNEFLKPTNTSTIVPKEPRKPSTNTSEKVRLLEIENPKVGKSVRFCSPIFRPLPLLKVV